MIEMLEYDFMRCALAAGVAASVLCGLIGVYVILNRIVFISDGIAHTAFGGIGLGYFLGQDPVLWGILFSLASALGIGEISRRSRISEDTVIGIFLATGMSLGIVLMSLSRGYSRDLFDYLFGNILSVTWWDVTLISALTLAVVVTVTSLYKELLILSFDPSYGEAMGLPARELRMALLFMVALSVVVLIKIVGIIMVIALLTIPGSISRQHLKDLRAIMVASILLGMFFVISGLAVSYVLDVPSGATIILTGSAAFAVSTALRRKLPA